MDISSTVSNSVNIKIFYLKNVLLLTDGVPSSQNPTAAIESWINHNKVEREEYSDMLVDSLKVKMKTQIEANFLLVILLQVFFSNKWSHACFPFFRRLVKTSTYT